MDCDVCLFGNWIYGIASQSIDHTVFGCVGMAVLVMELSTIRLMVVYKKEMHAMLCIFHIKQNMISGFEFFFQHFVRKTSVLFTKLYYSFKNMQNCNNTNHANTIISH